MSDRSMSDAPEFNRPASGHPTSDRSASDRAFRSHPWPIAALAGGSGFRGDERFAILDAAADLSPSELPEPDRTPPVDLHAQGWDEGYAAGLAEARAEAAGRFAAEAQARDALGLCMTRIDAALEARLCERLRETVTALCEATLAPLALDADALVRRVERAAAMLARAEDERVVRLHPETLALVADRLGEALTLRPDASLARGAVRVEGASGGVEDGPAQWRAAIETALERC